MGNSTSYQMFGAVLFTEHHTVVIDGGLEEDAPNLYRVLKEAGTKTISAWFFTHPHHDHLGAFMVYTREKWEFPLEKMYLNFPTRDILRLCPAHKAHGGIERKMWEDIWDLLEGEYETRYQKIEKGDMFPFDSVALRVLRVWDPSFDLKQNYVNNSSAVFRLDAPETRVLLLGDLGMQGGEKLLTEYPPETFFAHYTQMAHHGQKGVNRAFYEAIRPVRCLWPTPEKIWDNVGEGGPGTGKWDTLETRKWMDEMGVAEHIVSKDGNAVIDLK